MPPTNRGKQVAKPRRRLRRPRWLAAFGDAVRQRPRRAPTETADMTASGELVVPFPIAGPATTSWREHALARAAEYRFLARLLLSQATDRDRHALLAIERHIDIAERAAAGRSKARDGAHGASDREFEATLGRWQRIVSFLGGAAVERTNSLLDTVESDLLRLAPDPYLRGQIPNLVAHVRTHLPLGDPRRQQVEEVGTWVARHQGEPLSELHQDQLLSAVRAASLEARREIRRVRSFRNVLFVSAFILTLGVAGMTVVGITSPGRVPVCFAPDDAMVVCPTAAQPVPQAAAPPTDSSPQADSAPPDEQSSSSERQVHIDELVRETATSWDIPVVEIVGLLAAALAGAYALRSIQGTSTPYSLPIAAAVLKLPTGALTAVFGLLLMRGGFIPGLSALDTSAQIIAWAVVFGYSQQLLTRFVDQQANSVLETVDTPTHPQLGAPSGQQPAQGTQPE
jgi:hypothetical protein